ncbi:class I SAM-dependent methyltransferase [Salinibaculum salinum]|uniref:class I SAM-dependent methyltransferase n=1 Tax=Salinibaculum salinum TaxID=3131996 RepID=UPI0030ECC128
MDDPFGRALRDHYHGECDDPLVHRDGAETAEHPIERFYFGTFPDDTQDAEWLRSWLDGPLLDVGAGAGEHALFFQTQFETVAIEPSEPLVETMRDRGVADARLADMFELLETFERDRFQSLLVHGTQLGLAGSRHGLRELLGEFASVTTTDATAVVDCYDPTAGEVSELLGYRSDPTPGLASRVLTFEYGDDVSETLLFRLFSPDRLREATTGTGWAVSDVQRPSNDHYYRAALTKG